MTETGKAEETADLPLEGSPKQKQPAAMDSPLNRSMEDLSDAGESTPTASSVALLKTPTSSRMSDADCFKTPEPLTPTSASKKRKRLTPEEKSLREKERQEKRRKLEEEKLAKEQERLEKAKQREAEKLRKEEEKRRLEEEKRLERLKKEEERKKIEEEKKQERLKKEEERLKKEEERKKIEEEKKQEKLKKEEERKKKEDEKKQKEEEKERERLKAEEKKKKHAQFFQKYFTPKSPPKVHTIENGTVRAHEQPSSGEPVGAENCSKNSSLFNPLPFQIKTDMAVAPLCRRNLSKNERETLDSLFCDPSTCSDDDQSGRVKISVGYLQSIKKGRGRTDVRTEVILKDSPEIQILNEENGNSNAVGCFRWRMKLLQFEENKRPAYWGTWKRKIRKINARRPFTREDEVDYEFDSDDEWEDEPDDAEEIGVSGDEADDQEEGGDPEEDEEGWMVPHGYLSDSEREGKSEGLEALKNKEKEFYKSLKEKTLIGFPFILTENLSCFAMRVCPVFKSATEVKKRKPRAPRKKAVVEVKETEVKQSAEMLPPPPPPAVTQVADPPKADPCKETNQRKSDRKRKVVDDKPNPYAKPPSGFLALQLPSDDEEDMDWEENDASSSSESESDDDEENASDSSDSNDDLFTPVVSKKPKK